MQLFNLLIHAAIVYADDNTDTTSTICDYYEEVLTTTTEYGDVVTLATLYETDTQVFTVTASYYPPVPPLSKTIFTTVTAYASGTGDGSSGNGGNGSGGNGGDGSGGNAAGSGNGGNGIGGNGGSGIGGNS